MSTMDASPRDEWAAALRAHEREIDRLCVEISLLERERRQYGHSDALSGILRLQIEFANAQLTRHRIGAALMSARLRSVA